MVTVLEIGLQRVFPLGSVIRTWYVCVDPTGRFLSTNPILGSVQKFESPVVEYTHVLLSRRTS